MALVMVYIVRLESLAKLRAEEACMRWRGLCSTVRDTRDNTYVAHTRLVLEREEKAATRL